MDFERYHRQIILRDFGQEAQQKLSKAKVLVVGAGGLGVPVLTYLNAMGVGTIGIVENDTVSFTNLHRQVLYDESHIGLPKIEIALEKLRNQNSQTILIGHETFLSVENALEIINEFDVVVDATDNFPTRYLINDACVILNKAFVYGALHGYEGQVSVFNYQGGPTYRCLFPNMPHQNEIPDCNINGVLGIIPGIIGNFQALEAIKIISGIGEALSGQLLLYDGLAQSFQKIKFSRVPANMEIKSLQADYDFECSMEVQSIDTTAVSKLSTIGNIQLIDVRTKQEFDNEHIENAKNIPLSELEKRKEEIDFGSPIYVICQSGIRSQKAIAELSSLQPHTRFIHVKYGMQGLKYDGAKH